MSINFPRIFNVKNEAIAVAVFSFLTAIVVSLFVLKKDIYSMKSMVDVFSHQIGIIKISKGRMLLFVFEKRIIHFFILLLFSGFLKRKFRSLVFYAGFFFLYGVFLMVNIYLMGVEGLLTGLLLMIPHWIIYFMVYSRIFKYEKAARKYVRFFELLIMIFVLFIASIIETYVNLLFIYKIL